MQFSKAPVPIVSVFVLFRSVHPPVFSWLANFVHAIANSNCWHTCWAAIISTACIHQSRYEYHMPEAVSPLLCSVASLIPMLKGVPRYGGGHWGGIKAFTPDAEITVGRIAMLVRSDRACLVP
jgi:hypothetical protein